jgi:poly(3-hydroxybutyrate) depolymerase
LNFLATLLPQLQSELCIDQKRIYAAGKSLGGGMTDALACDPNLGPQFAAFAPVSGAFYWDNDLNYTSCNPGLRSKTPMLEFHGLNDTRIPYTGGTSHETNIPSIADWAKRWVSRNGCDNVGPSVEKLYGGNVKKIEYQGCEVQHWVINGLKHAWPSTEPNFDNSQGTYLNATPIILDWFRNHTLS